MFASDPVVPMRPKGQVVDRRAATPRKSRRPNLDALAKAAATRLPAIIYRKYGGELEVKLSEFTLERLADGIDISLGERQAELRLNLCDLLDRDGLVDPGVIRRRADRLQIIERAVEDCVESGDVDSFIKRCRIIYRLPRGQMKRQAKALREHEQAHAAKRQRRLA